MEESKTGTPSPTTEDWGRCEPPEPHLEYLGRGHIYVALPVWDLGQVSSLGALRIIPIAGGYFQGPRLKGKIPEYGADQQVVTPDGLATINARFLLQTDDGALIHLHTRGYRHGPPAVMQSVAQGEAVDPRLYYFRLSVEFETGFADYLWLNRSMAFGIAMRLSNSIVFDTYLY